MIRIEEELVVNNKTIDARILSRMFLAGAKNLEAKKEWINELNVFPVPVPLPETVAHKDSVVSTHT